MPLDAPAPDNASAQAEGEATFLRRLMIGTFGLFLVVLIIYLLREFKSFLQPLFVAIFISYVVQAAHRRLVRGGVPSTLAYIVLVALLVIGLIGLGTLVYNNVARLVDRLPFYEERLRKLIMDLLTVVGVDREEQKEFLDHWFDTGTGSAQQTAAQIRAWLGTFVDFFGALAVTAVYLLFVTAERTNFARRILHALTPRNAKRILHITTTINEAISDYLGVLTFVSFLGGALTIVILAPFSVDFFITWGILAFLFNFIPYLGSLVATVLPILLALVQLGWWQALVIGVLLITMQQVLGTLVQPRLTGQKLNVSPLLILLSLSFWGVVWGIVGMILAVPLLVSIKIVLDNIEQTRPIAALMANMAPEAGTPRG